MLKIRNSNSLYKIHIFHKQNSKNIFKHYTSASHTFLSLFSHQDTKVVVHIYVGLQKNGIQGIQDDGKKSDKEDNSKTEMEYCASAASMLAEKNWQIVEGFVEVLPNM